MCNRPHESSRFLINNECTIDVCLLQRHGKIKITCGLIRLTTTGMLDILVATATGVYARTEVNSQNMHECYTSYVVLRLFLVLEKAISKSVRLSIR